MPYTADGRWLSKDAYGDYAQSQDEQNLIEVDIGGRKYISSRGGAMYGSPETLAGQMLNPYVIPDPEFQATGRGTGYLIPYDEMQKYNAAKPSMFNDPKALLPLAGALGLIGGPIATSLGAYGGAATGALQGAGQGTAPSFANVVGGASTTAGSSVAPSFANVLGGASTTAGSVLPTLSQLGTGASLASTAAKVLGGDSGDYKVLDNYTPSAGASTGGAMDMGIGDAAMRDQFLGLNSGNTDLMRTLMNLGIPAGAINSILSGAGSGIGSLLGGAGGGLGGLLGGAGGGLWDLLGNALNTKLGYDSAKDAADRYANVNQQMLDMAERDRQDRLPFINQSRDWLQNPSSYWSGAAGQEIARQTARSIGGARQENLFDNPTGQSLVMQSLVPSWMNAVTQTGNLGLKNTAPLNTLGQMGLQSAEAAGRPDAVLGGGLASLFNPTRTGLDSQNDALRRMLQGGGGTYLS